MPSATMTDLNEEYTTCTCGAALPEGKLLCPPCEWEWNIQQADFGTVLAEIKNTAGKYTLDIEPDGGWLEVSMSLRDELTQNRVTSILEARRAKYMSGKGPWWVFFWIKSGDHGSLEFAEV